MPTSAAEMTAFMKKHDVETKLSSALNAAIRDGSEDPLSYIAQTLLSASKGAASVPPVSVMTEKEVVAAQTAWANAIKDISKIFLEKGDYVAAARKAYTELYGYDETSILNRPINVLFKPAKASEHQFRPTFKEGLSYFVGGSSVEGGYEEDGGLAINNGKGWSDVVVETNHIELNPYTAIAMGNVWFTCAATGFKTKVEHTFGYKKNKDGKVRIFLHHASVPYGYLAVTEKEVKDHQQAWANAITDISKKHKESGDYVAAARDATKELYAYGHWGASPSAGNVLFKPCKPDKHQFRATSKEALSYFVGGSAVEGGHPEDKGFAINAGKGWSEIVFDNHQIYTAKGGNAIAMGNYSATCATTGSKTLFEYTMGYTRNGDGKVRMFLHHASVPFCEQ